MLRKRRLCALFAAVCLTFTASPPALGAKQTSARTGLLEAVNASRVSRGLRPLQLDAALDRAALSHTLVMLRTNVFAHGDFAGRMLAFHLRGTLGENLAWGSGAYAHARTIVRLWLASPEHRANLLSPAFRRIGLGLAQGSFQGAQSAIVVTADFGS